MWHYPMYVRIHGRGRKDRESDLSKSTDYRETDRYFQLKAMFEMKWMHVKCSLAVKYFGIYYDGFDYSRSLPKRWPQHFFALAFSAIAHHKVIFI